MDVPVAVLCVMKQDQHEQGYRCACCVLAGASWVMPVSSVTGGNAERVQGTGGPHRRSPQSRSRHKFRSGVLASCSSLYF